MSIGITLRQIVYAHFGVDTMPYKLDDLADQLVSLTDDGLVVEGLTGKPDIVGERTPTRVTVCPGYLDVEYGQTMLHDRESTSIYWNTEFQIWEC